MENIACIEVNKLRDVFKVSDKINLLHARFGGGKSVLKGQTRGNILPENM